MGAPFHADELRAQALAGQSANGAGIRAFMPDQHREFFAMLPYLFVATTDEQGWPVASVWSGATGFAHSPDPTTLRIENPSHGLVEGQAIGILGLDFTNRRRNRANGRVAAADEHGATIHVLQSFGNCAQYIQTRHPTPHPRQARPIETLAALDDAARQLIAGADTLFVASRSRDGVGEAAGLDMSHRGGRPGFVRIDRDTLVIPDFRGNRFFNTLGNLMGDPRAGLLFIDFESGDLLQLQGEVTIGWNADAGLAGAQRVWQLAVERVWRHRSAFPFSWVFGDYAPTTLATGTWEARSGA
jgi:uncharacterized protein